MLYVLIMKIESDKVPPRTDQTQEDVADKQDAVGIQRGNVSMVRGIKMGWKNMREQLGELASDAKKEDAIAGKTDRETFPSERTSCWLMSKPREADPSSDCGRARHAMGYEEREPPSRPGQGQVARARLRRACQGDGSVAELLR